MLESWFVTREVARAFGRVEEYLRASEVLGAIPVAEARHVSEHGHKLVVVLLSGSDVRDAKAEMLKRQSLVPFRIWGCLSYAQLFQGRWQEPDVGRHYFSVTRTGRCFIPEMKFDLSRSGLPVIS